MSRQLGQASASHWNPNDYSWSPQRLCASEIEDIEEQEEPRRELVTEPVPRNGEHKRCKQVKRVKLPESADVICEVPFCSHVCVGRYYKKYRVCIEHAKAQSVSITGVAARFCQKCAKFHPVTSFDGRNKSCRVTLYEHNRRRRLQNVKVDPLKEASKKVSKVGKHGGRRSSARDVDSNDKNNKRGSQEEAAEVRAPMETLASDEITHNSASAEILSMDESADLLDSDIPEGDTKPYDAEEVQLDLALKFEGRTPSDLPINLVDDILNGMPSTGWIEGTARPGCTHVTASLRLKRHDYDKVVNSDRESALQNAFEQIWRGSKGITSGLKVRMPVLGLSKLPVSVSRFCARMQPGPVTLDLYGHDIHDPMMVAFCRQNGKYLTTTILGSDCDSFVDDDSEEEMSDGSDASDAGSHRSILDKYPESVQSEDGCALQKKSVQILGLDVGSCEIDLVLEDSVIHSLSLLILPPSAIGAEEEVQRLAAGNRNKPWMKNFIRDVGMVLRHLYGSDPLAECHLEMIQRLASQTVAYCLECNSVELARLLQPAIPENDSVCRPLEVKTNNETENRESPEKKKAGHGEHQGLYPESLHAEFTKNLLEEVSKANIGAAWLDYGWENVFMQMIFGFGILVFSTILVLSDAS